MFALVWREEVCISPTLNSRTQPLPCVLVFLSAHVKGDVDFQFLCDKTSRIAAPPQFSWQHFPLPAVNSIYLQCKHH